MTREAEKKFQEIKEKLHKPGSKADNITLLKQILMILAAQKLHENYPLDELLKFNKPHEKSLLAINVNADSCVYLAIPIRSSDYIRPALLESALQELSIPTEKVITPDFLVTPDQRYSGYYNHEHQIKISWEIYIQMVQWVYGTDRKAALEKLTEIRREALRYSGELSSGKLPLPVILKKDGIDINIKAGRRQITAEIDIDVSVPFVGKPVAPKADEFVLIIDVSQSMTEKLGESSTKIASAIGAAKRIVEQLPLNSKLSIAAFRSTTTVIRPLQAIGSEVARGKIISDLGAITASGGTNFTAIAPALDQAHSSKTAEKKTVIILTDGQFDTSEDPNEVKEAIRQALSTKSNQVSIVPVGIGHAGHEKSLERLSTLEKGYYYPITDGSFYAVLARNMGISVLPEKAQIVYDLELTTVSQSGNQVVLRKDTGVPCQMTEADGFKLTVAIPMDTKVDNGQPVEVNLSLYEISTGTSNLVGDFKHTIPHQQLLEKNPTLRRYALADQKDAIKEPADIYQQAMTDFASGHDQQLSLKYALMKMRNLDRQQTYFSPAEWEQKKSLEASLALLLVTTEMKLGLQSDHTLLDAMLALECSNKDLYTEEEMHAEKLLEVQLTLLAAALELNKNQHRRNDVQECIQRISTVDEELIVGNALETTRSILVKSLSVLLALNELKLTNMKQVAGAIADIGLPAIVADEKKQVKDLGGKGFIVRKMQLQAGLFAQQLAEEGKVGMEQLADKWARGMTR